MTLFLLVTSFTLIGQTFSELQKEFRFEKETEEKEISFPAYTNTLDIGFFLKSQIGKGELKVFIYDPNGKKEGGFHLEAISKEEAKNKASTSNSNKGSNIISYTITEDEEFGSSGSMNKSISKPIPGTWRVKIIATKLTGALSIQLKQMVQD